MSFRARLTLVAAAAVALAVVIASAVIYVVVRGELRGPVDDGLRATATDLARLPPDDIARSYRHLQAEFGNAAYPQFVNADGSTLPVLGVPVSFPVDDKDRAIAAKGRGQSIRDAHVQGVHVRMLTVGYVPGTALQVVRTHRGNTLLFNIHLSDDAAPGTLFPSTETVLSNDLARMLFRMSSALPDFCLALFNRNEFLYVP